MVLFYYFIVVILFIIQSPQTASRVYTELMYVNPCWSANTSTSMCYHDFNSTLSLSLSLSLSHTHTHTYIHIYINLSCIYSLSLSHTHTHTHKIWLERFIFLNRFWSVYIPLILIVKSLAQFPVDHLSHPVMSTLIFRLWQFVAFAYYVINCLISVST